MLIYPKIYKGDTEEGPLPKFNRDLTEFLMMHFGENYLTCNAVLEEYLHTIWRAGVNTFYLDVNFTDCKFMVVRKEANPYPDRLDQRWPEPEPGYTEVYQSKSCIYQHLISVGYSHQESCDIIDSPTHIYDTKIARKLEDLEEKAYNSWQIDLAKDIMGKITTIKAVMEKSND